MTWCYSVVLGEGQDPLSEVDEPMQGRVRAQDVPAKTKVQGLYCYWALTVQAATRLWPTLQAGDWILDSHLLHCKSSVLFHQQPEWDFIATHNEVFVKKELVAVKSLEGVWVDGQSLPHAPLKRGPSRKREEGEVISLALTLTMLTHWTAVLKTKILRLNH